MKIIFGINKNRPPPKALRDKKKDKIENHDKKHLLNRRSYAKTKNTNPLQTHIIINYKNIVEQIVTNHL